jgi:hypothetical protein
MARSARRRNSKANAVDFEVRVERTADPQKSLDSLQPCKKVTNAARSKCYTYADFNVLL